ncbi:hypothetical protein ASPZODRAFT_27137 [Penicilliopsis zonata CBS 506.65]|uniref:Zn(2)-C6 fungal-type domain-containing protein n=1 Tax=Penicilliopsis zonata CBS 506.65 TaxID=1073090 RepID=A0A1L9SDG2_9EURO|nr:hypothetical protein ASPZODRAFT_27137 [Penicilliopsis zonata CBS 506.65]OJJ45127.1 hypothetical protein ASPZODRAFT_27137 [Penicilliopsis zonata CBS 506.65]
MPPRNGFPASRSCGSCRAVKRRCDLQTPQCGQCMRKGEKCPGYRDEWELVFRDQTTRTIKQHKAKTARKMGSISHSTPSACNLNAGAGVDLHSLGHQQLLPPAVTTSPMMRHQVFSSYLDGYFPNETGSSIDKLRFIISGISALPRKNIMLEKALSALPCVFLGKIHSDNHLLQHGLQLYNSAIQYMLYFISRKAYTDDIIYTCVIFLQIQAHHCPSSLGEWLAHVDGLTAIMKYYDPKTFTSPILAVIHGQYHRFKVLIARLTYHSEETIAWLKQPFGGDGAMKDFIMNLVEISRIAAAIDTIDVSDQNACQSLLEDSLALEKSHMDLYAQIDGNTGGEAPTYARGELKTGVPATDDLFGPAYRFSSLDDALLHMFFWLSLSFVHPLICQCQVLAKTEAPGNYSQSEALRISTFCVNQAVRCLPYCGQEGMNLWGIYYGVLCAVQVVRVYCHVRDWDRFLWAQDLFAYLKALGFDHAAHVGDIWAAYWFDSSRHHFYRTMDYGKVTDQKDSIYKGTEATSSHQNG